LNSSDDDDYKTESQLDNNENYDEDVEDKKMKIEVSS
jgi:hypothetical protein